MRKGIVLIVMVMTMLILSTGVASAAWWLEIEPSAPTYPANSFNIVYHEDAAESHTTMNISIYVFYEDNGPETVSVTTNAGALGMMQTAAVDDGNGGAHFGMFAFPPGPNFNDNTLLGTITYNGGALAGALAFDLANPSFGYDVSGVGQTGIWMDTNGHLTPAGGAPAPPIAEIITIVLVSMGLIALGGYVWYRRHRAKAALVAA